MLKNPLAATGYAVLLWLLIFMEVSVIMFGFTQLSDLGQRLLWLAVEIPLVLYCCGLYLRKYQGDLKTGLFLGLWFVIIGTILDMIITVPFFAKSYASFYSAWSLWIGFIITIGTCGLAGYVLEKK
jgi:hypothetical protein